MFENTTQTPLIASVKFDTFSQLLKIGKKRNYKKGAVIFLESDVSDNFFIILSGNIKVSRLNQDGKEVVIAILDKGNFFGEMGLLNDFDRSTDVTAEENSELLLIRSRDFFDILEQNPDLILILLKELARRIRHSISQIKSLTLLNSRGKVASALLRWAADVGDEKNNTMYICNVPTQKEMASYVGLTRETFNRVLKKLEKEKFIKVCANGDFIIPNYYSFKKIFGPFF